MPGQRDHERLHLQVVDDQPHREAQRGADEQHDEQHRHRAPARGQELRREHAGQRHDGADREVDAAGDDHERHADGEHDQVGVVDEQVEQHLAARRSRRSAPTRRRTWRRRARTWPARAARAAAARRRRGAGAARCCGGAGARVAAALTTRPPPRAPERAACGAEQRAGLRRLQQADGDDHQCLEHQRDLRRDARGVDGGGEGLETSAPTSVPTSEYRPPVSSVPPMTTARIASSSIHRPALLASAAVTLELIISPARQAHTATKT